MSNNDLLEHPSYWTRVLSRGKELILPKNSLIYDVSSITARHPHSYNNFLKTSIGQAEGTFILNTQDITGRLFLTNSEMNKSLFNFLNDYNSSNPLDVIISRIRNMSSDNDNRISFYVYPTSTQKKPSSINPYEFEPRLSIHCN